MLTFLTDDDTDSARDDESDNNHNDPQGGANDDAVHHDANRQSRCQRFTQCCCCPCRYVTPCCEKMGQCFMMGISCIGNNMTLAIDLHEKPIKLRILSCYNGLLYDCIAIKLEYLEAETVLMVSTISLVPGSIPSFQCCMLITTGCFLLSAFVYAVLILLLHNL